MNQFIEKRNDPQMKIDLKDTTFIIPIYIESSDRKLNTLISLSYLTKHLDTNIIILEHDVTSKVPEILKQLGIEDKVDYIFSNNMSGNEIFHRTRFLNEMLVKVKTPVVVNYDVDVLLKPEVYLECRDRIISGSDLVYPYFWGVSQWQIYNSGRDKIEKNLSLDILLPSDYNLTRSEYGHCQFFNAKSYREGGMENEIFMSYGPEDKERGYRFKKLGYKVEWLNNIIHHITHSRGINSSGLNPFMRKNNELLKSIESLSEDELRSYYKNIDYIKKYK